VAVDRRLTAVDERPRFTDESQPGEFKTACDGQGGLVRVRLTGGPHAGRSLYIDEHDLPPAIYTTGAGRRFEWWPERNQAYYATLPLGRDPDAPPVRHELRVPDDTHEPVFEAVTESVHEGATTTG
jgi:hypothetical protein